MNIIFKDIEEREITEYKTETIKKTDLVDRKQEVTYNISLCVNTPQSNFRTILSILYDIENQKLYLNQILIMELRNILM